MSDKKNFSYSFSCDGLGRDDICNILTCDVFYLVIFWMLNIIGWVTFFIGVGNTSHYDKVTFCSLMNFLLICSIIFF